MKTSKREDYAIVLMAALAREREFVPLKSIAGKFDLPYPFMKQIANTLVRANLLKAKGGATGGYKLAKPANKVSWRDIMVAVSGEPKFVECLRKREERCPVLDQCPSAVAWKHFHKVIMESLDKIKLSRFVGTPS